MAESTVDINAHVQAFLNEQPLKAGCKLVLAYSGGVDSEVLACALAYFAKTHTAFRYLLVHVHHGLSDNADTWAAHCQSRAQQYGLPIAVERVTVKCGPRLSLEAQARSARYHVFEQYLEVGDVLLTAHHEDDQLETVLLALKRGQGPKGLAAMGQVQAFAQGRQLRPLLELSRESIETYAELHALPHIEDESNQDDKFDRNFLRLEIIPRLKARWPSIATTASRSAALCAEQQSTLDDQVSERLPLWLTRADFSRQEVFKLDGFDALTPNWQALLLRAFIEKHGFALPSLVQLQQVIRQLIDAKDDAKVCIRVGDCEIRRFAGQVFLRQHVKCEAPKKTDILLSNSALNALARGDIPELLVLLPHNIENDDGCNVHFLQDNQGPRVRFPKDDEAVSIRYHLAGQFRCHPHDRDKGRELKKLWQEYAVPPWEREHVGFVFYGEQLVMALGLWVEKGFRVEGYQFGLRAGLR